MDAVVGTAPAGVGLSLFRARSLPAWRTTTVVTATSKTSTPATRTRSSHLDDLIKVPDLAI